ncbi:MAG: methylmalonyl Co-A mutase-associated GTPase MeaB [Candidatus Marinimicrobia bacterium]|nr:methylmalonyl Co-A mutase-associated GTPase MeaB [Candidatus Neomarinimicrobiota bacterium]
MIKSLISGLVKKNIIDLAKSITIVENRSSGYKELLSELSPSEKKCHKIGITGPPGSGKSTLTNALCKKIIKQNKKVGVICVDPSSPFQGGAILGDRIRMKDLNPTDVFIRSFSSRGSLGGLSQSILNVESLYESFGFDVIVYETVGVGQIELDIVDICDTLLLCLTPESGDEIQMMKSGLLECCDVIAINKSDRDGADRLKISLQQIFDISSKIWTAPIINTVGIKDLGINKLLLEIEGHYKFLSSNNDLKNKVKSRYISKLKNLAQEYLLDSFFNNEREQLIEDELSKDDVDRISVYSLFEKIKYLDEK